MDHQGITPQLREQKKIAMRKGFNFAGLIFLIICLLPLAIYGLYSADVLKSVRVSEFQDLEAPTALVFNQLSGSTGTAFLVSDTKLMTARHVVDDLNIGDKVLLRFEKANPSMETQATLEWMASTTNTKGRTGLLPHGRRCAKAR